MVNDVTVVWLPSGRSITSTVVVVSTGPLHVVAGPTSAGAGAGEGRGGGEDFGADLAAARAGGGALLLGIAAGCCCVRANAPPPASRPAVPDDVPVEVPPDVPVPGVVAGAPDGAPEGGDEGGFDGGFEGGSLGGSLGGLPGGSPGGVVDGGDRIRLNVLCNSPNRLPEFGKQGSGAPEASRTAARPSRPVAGSVAMMSRARVPLKPPWTPSGCPIDSGNSG